MQALFSRFQGNSCNFIHPLTRRLPLGFCAGIHKHTLAGKFDIDKSMNAAYVDSLKNITTYKTSCRYPQVAIALLVNSSQTGISLLNLYSL